MLVENHYIPADRLDSLDIYQLSVTSRDRATRVLSVTYHNRLWSISGTVRMNEETWAQMTKREHYNHFVWGYTTKENWLRIFVHMEVEERDKW